MKQYPHFIKNRTKDFSWNFQIKCFNALIMDELFVMQVIFLKKLLAFFLAYALLGLWSDISHFFPVLVADAFDELAAGRERDVVVLVLRHVDVGDVLLALAQEQGEDDPVDGLVAHQHHGQFTGQE